MSDRFRRHMKLARWGAKYYPHFIEYSDAMQAALFGLHVADQRLSPTLSDGEFIALARQRILGEIRDEVRRTVPESRRNKGATQMKPRRFAPGVVELLRNAGELPTVSKQVGDHRDPHFEQPMLIEPRPDAHETLLAQERQRLLVEAIEQLPPRWAYCVRQRLRGVRESEMAKALGVSEPRISQMLSKATVELRTKLQR